MFGAAVLQTAALAMPDALLTQAVQWAKACLLRPLSRYAIGPGITDNPGRSSSLVGRDTAWYTLGRDFVSPEDACAMLRVLAERQRADGLIPEWIDGRDGRTEDYGFNVNDGTPLFVLAVAHHLQTTGHDACGGGLYAAARRAAELLLRQRDERGLVVCRADGVGIEGI